MAHLPALPHGPLEPVFTDVWFVTGRFRMAPGVVIPRNMTVVREGERLVLLNSVRLSREGEAELDRLGQVTDVVRLGGGHGADDPYFQERYGATMWAPDGITSPHVAYRTLAEDASPLADATPFIFRHGRAADGAMIVARDGGILVSCDSYQNWTSYADCSFLAGVASRLMGFKPATIGGPWARRMGPGVHDDFVRLREQPFRHLLPGHGSPLRDRARDELAGAMQRRFGR